MGLYNRLLQMLMVHLVISATACTSFVTRIFHATVSPSIPFLEVLLGNMEETPKTPRSLPVLPLSVIKKLPKAELHLHLDGSVRVSTLLDLAEEQVPALDLNFH